jgi:predicted acetyltransferase
MMMTPFLTEPHIVYRNSYLQATREFQAEGRHLELDYQHLSRHFESFVQSWLERTDYPKPGRVPETIYWLVDADVFIGRLSLRHRLNESLMQFGGHIGYEIRPTQRLKGYGKLILRLGLEKAKAAGIQRALVTCDDDNIGSAKIIEANGGILENSILLTGRTVKTRRYWIAIE